MAVRHTHNRKKEEPMGKDYNEVLRKSKIIHKAYGSFYIKTIGDTYFSTIHKWGGEIKETWQNIGGHLEGRAKWIKQEKPAR